MEIILIFRDFLVSQTGRQNENAEFNSPFRRAFSWCCKWVVQQCSTPVLSISVDHAMLTDLELGNFDQRSVNQGC